MAALKSVKALWFEDGALSVIDQRKLPGERKVLRLTTVDEVAAAIRDMTVRGAPTIGVAAAYGMVLAREGDRVPPDEAARILRETRPTAHDLFVGIDAVLTAWKEGKDVRAAADAYREAIVSQCKAIGTAGAPLLKRNANVLTHCNAGALATVEWGTALAPVRVAHGAGLDPFVWVDETRPLLQGSRLTAWELKEEGIRHAVIADNAAGFFMLRGEVDLVLVGADRITMSGDFANKIGTYEKAVLAHENHIPFYVAAPWSTFDARLSQGKGIPIEERPVAEVTAFEGVSSAPGGSFARNPAFDVTPARYVTAFITPGGVIPPGDVGKVFKRKGGWA